MFGKPHAQRPGAFSTTSSRFMHNELTKSTTVDSNTGRQTSYLEPFGHTSPDVKKPSELKDGKFSFGTSRTAMKKQFVDLINDEADKKLDPPAPDTYEKPTSDFE